MTIAVLGDQHGDLLNLIKLIKYLNMTENPDCFIQVGDFGMKNEQLTQLNTFLEKINKDLYFIDGNHDDHKTLFIADHVTDKPTLSLRSHVHYVKRGSVLELFGKTFIFMGGAFTMQRVFNPFFKKEKELEMITAKNCADLLINAERYKDRDFILISHDVPFKYNDVTQRYKFDPKRARRNRYMLEVIDNELKPSMVIHGHYHTYYEVTKTFDDRTVTCIGLGRNEQPINKQFYIIQL